MSLIKRLREKAKEKRELEAKKKEQQLANEKAMQDAEKKKIYTIAGVFAVLGVAIVLYKTRKKMKWYNHPKDTRNLIIGIVASLFGVIVWEIIKEKKLWNKKTIEQDLDKI